MTDFPRDDPQDELPPSDVAPVVEPAAIYEPAANDSAANTPAAAAPAATDSAANTPAAAAPAATNDGPPPYVGPTAWTGVAPPPIRRLYRARHDRKLGGVSGGIAEFLRIDPTIVRLATLVLAIPGIGILAYLVAWVIIPLRPEGHVDPARSQPIANERTMTIAFGVATLALVVGVITGSWAVLAFALVGGGLWLLSENAPTRAPATVQGYAVPSGPMAYAPPQSQQPHQPYQSSENDSPSPDPPSGFPPPFTADYDQMTPRERTPQRVTWIVLSLLMLVTALGVTAAAGDWWDVRATHFLGAAIFIIAVGVVIGQTRGGGARGLIPLGVLATLALFPVTAVDGLLDGGVGAATYRPSNVQELESSYEHGIGQLTVDLSQLDFAGRSESIDIDLGIGELIVIVSEETGGRVALEARAGEVSHQLPATDSFLYEEGINASTGTLLLAGDDGMLDLNISVGFGTAELRTADK